MKKRTVTRGLSLLLCLLAAGSAFASCSSETEAGTNTPQKEDQTSAETSVQVQTEAVTEKIPGGTQLPETDMQGKDYHILSMTWSNYDPLNMDDICAEEENGDTMNDAVFKRQKSLEERFHCSIVQDNFNNDVGNTTLRKAITAGDDTYQIALIRSLYFNSYISSGQLYSLFDVPNLHMDEPWYDSNSISALGLLNSRYGIVSNITMNSYLLIFCAYFNQKLMEDFELGNMYDIVNSGKWTWNTLYTLGKAVAADLNNDGKATREDRYGFTFVGDIPEGLLNAAGVRYVTLDADGIPQITYSTEDAVTKMYELLDILKDMSTSFCMVRSSNQAVDEVGFFMDRKTLFDIGGIYYAEQFRDMEDHFGIIPLPKYNEEQEDYASPLYCNVFPITVVPATVQDIENTGILLDAMSYEGYYSLLPALYDVILQGKVTRDEDSNRMLDMIFGNTCYDSGILYNFGGITGTMRNILMYARGDFISTFEKSDARVTKDIDKLITAIEGME